MINDQILQYIKKEREKGIPADKIATDLVAGGGWNRSDVDEAFRSLNQEYLFPQKSPHPQVPKVAVATEVTPRTSPQPQSSNSTLVSTPISTPNHPLEQSTKDDVVQKSVPQVSPHAPHQKTLGLGVTLMLLVILLMAGLLIYFYFRFT